MIQSALGIVDKMRIEVYEDNKYNNPKKTIFVQLNPEKYSMQHNVVFYEGQPVGASSNDLQFNKIESEKVNFEFLFDSTGVVPPGKIKDGKGSMSFLENAANQSNPISSNLSSITKSVEDDLEAFKKLLLGYNGTTHETAYLHLIWGGYSLKCRLVSMDVQYSLFNNSGLPMRANAKCAFIGTATYKVMLAEQTKSSPDMTHERIYSMNDKISLMAEKIYGNPNYYIDVARSNALLSFRNANVGEPISFPPIK